MPFLAATWRLTLRRRDGIPQTGHNVKKTIRERGNSALNSTYVIDLIAGDGIGQEVVPAAAVCVDAVAQEFGFAIDWRERDWGSDHYRRTGRMMPVDGIDQLSTGDATLLGAVGAADIPDDVTLWGLLIPIRREFDQYVNLRPIRILPGITSPLAGVADLDIVVVRENVEGEYSEIGGRMFRGRAEEAAIQESVFTRRGIQRIAEFAVDQADKRRRMLVSATKSNGIIHTMPFWDQVVREVVHQSGAVEVFESVLIDALAARLVLQPHSIDVIVASNLFGDILSDLVAAVAGSIGIAPSANLNPPCKHPSMFEPVHGSAPDIAGQGIANPVGQMWAAALMLEHIGQPSAAAALMGAFEEALESGVRTPDLGGTASTAEFTTAVYENIRSNSHDYVHAT
jgi:tartrate dehydrogenase/decarboxylase/D-malate dehydrogenase